MNFWDWLNKNYERTGERFGYGKRIAVYIIIFLLIPILIYFIVTWDPAIGVDEDGEPIKLGVYIIIALYWLGAYFAYRQHEIKTKLNRLLDKLLDDEEANHLFDTAKKRRQINQEEKLPSKEGEKRAEWFVPR